jgi:AcrR family transcriptional regulator
MSAEVESDGRVARSERTREAIACALLELLEEGVSQPRAQHIAERAEVSVRTVFQHFDDMEGLYSEIAQRQTARIAPFLVALDESRTTHERARTLVEMRDSMYAIVAPVRKGVINSEAARKSNFIERGLAELRHAMNKQLRQGFAKEIHQHNEPTEVLSRMEAVTSFEMWDHFQHTQKASRTSTRAHMLSLFLREIVK